MTKEKKIARKYNSAIESHCAEAEFFAYHNGHPVLEARYFVEDGLEALRDDGWKIYNIEPRRPIEDFDENQEM